MIANYFELVFRLNELERATVVPTGRRERVLEHAVTVAGLALSLARKYMPFAGPEFERDILIAGLTHDNHEHLHGDVDSRNLTPEQRAQKEADEQEGHLALLKMARQTSVTLYDLIVPPHERPGRWDVIHAFVDVADKMAPKIVLAMSNGRHANPVSWEAARKMHWAQEKKMFEVGSKIAKALPREVALALRVEFAQVCRAAEAVLKSEEK